MRHIKLLSAAAGLALISGAPAFAWGCNSHGHGNLCNVKTHSKSYVEYSCPHGTTPVHHGGHTICKAPAKKTVVTRTYTTKTYVHETRSHGYVDHYAGGKSYGHGYSHGGGYGHTYVNSGFGTPFYGH